MKNFAKSILNYFATYNETRFRFDKKIDYLWTNDEYTLDLNVFQDFVSTVFDGVVSGKGLHFKIRSGQYAVKLDRDLMIEKIRAAAEEHFSESQIQKKLSESKKSTEQQVLRELNLEFRKKVSDILNELQEEKINEVKRVTETEKVPLSSFNPSIIEQYIYDQIGHLLPEYDKPAQFRKDISSVVDSITVDLTVFDLYSSLLTYIRYVGIETVYLYFHEISKGENVYPLYLVEMSLEQKTDEQGDFVQVQNARGIGLINVPAINFFQFERVLTLPRAARLEELQSPVHVVEQFLDGYYKVNKSFIFQLGFPTLVAQGLPTVSPRIGFQIVKNERRNILDYSEIITQLLSGAGEKFVGLISDYVESNVENTSNETYAGCEERYPSKSAKQLVHDIPLPLNTVQKRIITASDNPKNRIIVVDGPPGTGKSYAITALIYNAARKGKSVLVTSHKKQALDVVEEKLMDQFQRLHPKAKPSVLRLVGDKDKTPNSLDNTLRPAVITLSNSRAQNVPKETVRKDLDKGVAEIEELNRKLWSQTAAYQSFVDNYVEYLKLLSDLSLKDAGDISAEGKTDVSAESFLMLAKLIEKGGLSGPVDQVKLLLSRYADIPELSKKCEDLYQYSGQELLDISNGINTEDVDDLDALLASVKDAIVSEVPLREITMEGYKEPISDNERQIASYDELVKTLEILGGIEKERGSFIGMIRPSEKMRKMEDQIRSISEAFFERYKTEGVKKAKEFLEQIAQRVVEAKEKWPYLTEQYLYNGCSKLDPQELKSRIAEIRGLKYSDVIEFIAGVSQKKVDDLSYNDIRTVWERVKFSLKYNDARDELNAVASVLGSSVDNTKDVYEKLTGLASVLNEESAKRAGEALDAIDAYSSWFSQLGYDPKDIASLGRIVGDVENSKKIASLISLHRTLAQTKVQEKPSQDLIEEYNLSLQKIVDSEMDERFAELLSYPGDVSKIVNSVTSGKRIDSEQAHVLVDHIGCVLSQPFHISRTFPMEEDLFDLLVIDEASQVSIADSISLILRAKQTIVFGDELQYGAVGAMNVSQAYAGQYFKDILDDYVKDKNEVISEEEKEKIVKDVSRTQTEDDEESSESYTVSPQTKEWLKTFSVRTSTLSFCRALANYTDTLNVHFRSYPEIIGYSNEFFYRVSQTPLIINRIRTQPISEVLRFIKVETKGLAGQNINLDEIEVVRKELQSLYDSKFKGSIGVICSFKEQTARMEEILRKELTGYHRLAEENKLKVWFVGDVQGEERDIIYYSFVEDKKINNCHLTDIYPVVGGVADNIRKTKKQRLNVGFSRAKNTMVFVHSMPIEDYSDSVLGEALKYYETTLKESTDDYVIDEGAFESPAERDLYALIKQTKFYRENQGNLHLIAQFEIGKYLSEEFKRYVPDYRVDFLLTYAKTDKSKSLILEYDGLEYHFKDTNMTTKYNFSEQYLEYDTQRQIELESYGYKFLRINKFNLLPEQKSESKVDVLNRMLLTSFTV